MTNTATEIGVSLSSEFANALPELALSATAARPGHPSLLALNESLARELHLDPAWLRSEAGLRFLLGNELPEGATPVAQAYAGHQFGAYSPRLGDGRALLLGELTHRSGELRDVHLKGSGPTPFTRGDGFAAVGPMLREYFVGEAMHALGIPTTRALAVVSTGQRVMRAEAIDLLPGAVLARTAASHLRVGSFQLVRSTNDLDLLQRLTDHAIARHYPAAAGTDLPALALLVSVIEAQARLTASWMLTGFVYGVMNTDNMTVSGEGLDYGPCAFLDEYDSSAVFSSIDHAGRYAYGNQPGIALWNLTRFAESLLPLLATDTDSAKTLAIEALDRFSPAYDRAWLTGMRAKLGLDQAHERLSDESVTELARQMLSDMQARRVDFTRCFRALAVAARGDLCEVRELFGGVESDASDDVSDSLMPGDWLNLWLAAAPDPDAMDRVNPVYIPRNELLDEALETASAGDTTLFFEMLELVTHPFDRRDGFERYEMPVHAGLRRHITYCGT